MTPGPSVLRNFNPGIFGKGFLQNPGIPGFFGTGLTYCFHPGIDGILGFFTLISLSRDFLEKDG